MTKTFKKSLALILSVLMLMSVMPMSLSLAAEEGDFVYEVEDEKATIIGYTGTETDIVIPKTLGGYPVVAIGVEKESAKANNFMPFHSNATVTNVTIPGSVEYIGYGAFYQCTSLIGVALGEGLKVIDEGAFRSCSSLESILLGWNITTVGVNAFKDCSSLTWLSIGVKLSSVGKESFKGCASPMVINYEGTSEQWGSIDFDSGNENVKESEEITFHNGASCGVYGHPTEMTPKKDPTCTENGNVEYYTCKVCGEIFADDIEDGEDVIIPAKGHNPGEPGVDYTYYAPTCKDEGYHGIINCIDCEELIANGKGIPALDHNYVKDEDKSWEPTCDDNAENKEGYYYGVCSMCEDVKEEILPALEHNYEVWTESDLNPATCVSLGLEFSYCTGCGKQAERSTATFNPDKHTNLVKTDANDATCENVGNIEYWSCEGCHKIYSDAAATNEITAVQTVIDPINHAYGDYWTYDEATGKHKTTCTNDATHIKTENCTDVAIDTDCLCDKCGHLVAHNFADATCEDAATCTVCRATTGEPTGHAYGEYVYDAETEKHYAVCANDEEHIDSDFCMNTNPEDDCECDVCYRVMDHDFALANCIAPATCRVCGEEEGEIDPDNHIGHSIVETEEYREATCVSAEYTKNVTRCLGCGEVLETEEITGEIDPDNHQIKQVIPNNGKDKEHYFICEREGCDYKENIDHDLSYPTIIDEATCTKKGRLREYCSICTSYIYTEIDMIPHVDANKNAKCDVCDKSLETPEDTKPDTPTPENPAPEEPSETCPCNCHKSGIMGLFFKFILFFQKLFGINKECDCGAAHY